jgi:hypothetical protein
MGLEITLILKTSRRLGEKRMNNFVVRAKRAIKKIAVLAGSAAFAASTLVVPAMAQLESLPAPLVTNSVFTGYVVVGSADVPGIASDIAGSGDIIAGFSNSGVSTGGSVTVIGGKSKDIPLDRTLDDGTYGFQNTLNDNDLAGLQDKEITVSIGDEKNDYDIHDEVQINAPSNALLSGNITLETGLTVSSPDEDYGSDAFLIIESASIGYYYVFDDSIQAGNYLNDSTTDDPINIDFLGKKLLITGASTATRITAQVGTEYYLNIGDSVEVEGSTITLKNVGSGGAVIVDIDGVTKQISAAGTEEIGDIEVYNQEFFYTNELAERAATLVIGEEATKTYSDGDAYVGEDTDNPEWIWDIAGTNTASPTLGIMNGDAMILDDPDDNPPTVGDSMAFPNDFITLTVESYAVTNNRDYSFDADGGKRTLYNPNGSTAMYTSLGRDLIHLHADGGGDDGFRIRGNDTDDIYFYDNGTFLQYYWYDNDVNKPVFAGSNKTFAVGDLKMIYDDTTYRINIFDYDDDSLVWLQIIEADAAAAAGTPNISITFRSDGALKDYYLEKNTDLAYVNYTDAAGTSTDISDWEKDTRTREGTIIYDPDESNYELKFGVPGDDGTNFRVNIAFSTQSSTIVSGGGGGAVTMPVGVTKTDTEVSASTLDRPVVLVGGPVVNSLVADLASAGKTMTTADWREDVDTDGTMDHTDEAIIEMVENAFGTHSALIVAGHEAKDTRLASKALANTLKGGAGRLALTGTKATLDTSATSYADVTIKT